MSGPGGRHGEEPSRDFDGIVPQGPPIDDDPPAVSRQQRVSDGLDSEPIVPIGAAEDHVPPSPTPRRWQWRALIGIAAVAVVITVIVLAYRPWQQNETQQRAEKKQDPRNSRPVDNDEPAPPTDPNDHPKDPDVAEKGTKPNEGTVESPPVSPPGEIEPRPSAPISAAASEASSPSLLPTELTAETLVKLQDRLRKEPFTDQQLGEIADWARRQWNSTEDAQLRDELSRILIDSDFSSEPVRKARLPGGERKASGDARRPALSPAGITYFVSWQQPADMLIPPVQMDPLDQNRWRIAADGWQKQAPELTDADRARFALELARLCRKYGDERAMSFSDAANSLFEAVLNGPEFPSDAAYVKRNYFKAMELRQLLQQDELAESVRKLETELAQIKTQVQPPPGSVVAMDSVRQFLDDAESLLGQVQSSEAPAVRGKLAAVRSKYLDKKTLTPAEAAEFLGLCQQLTLKILHAEVAAIPEPVFPPPPVATKDQALKFLSRIDLDKLQPSALEKDQKLVWDRLASLVEQLTQKLQQADGLSLAEVSDLQVGLTEVSQLTMQLQFRRLQSQLAGISRPSKDDVPPPAVAAIEWSPCGPVYASPQLPGLQAMVEHRLNSLEQSIGTQISTIVQEVLVRLADLGYATAGAPAGGARPAPEAQPVVPASRPMYDPNAASLAYSEGVRLYFSTEDPSADLAVKFLNVAVAYDPDEPIYRHFLALALLRQGRTVEAAAQARAGGMRERGGYRRQQVAQSLERVQGPSRIWLEKQRMAALVASLPRRP